LWLGHFVCFDLHGDKGVFVWVISRGLNSK
jgi:hypothetical protein